MTGIRAGVLTCVGLLLFLAPHLCGAQTSNPQAKQYYDAGGKLYAQKNYSQAARYYQAAFTVDPNYADAYQGIGSCWYALGNKQYALAYFNKALKINPNNTRLAQFVQSMGGQAPTGGTTGTTTAAATDPMAQGSALFRQQQYAQAIGYFQQAIQQNPNNYQPYYYTGYSYYAMKDNKNAALYFAIANQKQPNAAIKSYADRIKASLTPDDQRWVDDQVAKSSQGGAAVAQGGASKPSEFGFHILGGMGLGIASPAQITDAATAAGTVSLYGTTPDSIPSGGLEVFYRLAPTIELNFGGSFTPVGNLSYTSVYLDTANGPASVGPPVPSSPATMQYTYNTNVMTGSLGGRVLFGDSKMQFYLGLAADISPISLTFTKKQLDGSGAAMDTSSDPNTYAPGTLTDFNSTGNYSTMAIGGHALLGMDLELAKNISVGPYVGYRFLNATDFANGSDKLMVNSDTSDVGPQSQFTKANVKNAVALKLDYSNVMGGINITFGF